MDIDVHIDRTRGPEETEGVGVWHHLVNPRAGEVRALRERLGVHPLALADAESGRSYPMIAGFDTHLVIAATDVRADGSDAGELTLAIGRNELATVQRGDPAALRDLGPVIRSSGAGDGPAAAAYRILEAVAADYAAAADRVEVELDGVELERAESLVPHTGRDLRRISDIRKESGRVSRAVSGLSETFDAGGDAIDRFLEFDRELVPYFQHLQGMLRAVQRRMADQDAAIDAAASEGGAAPAGRRADVRTISAVAALVVVDVAAHLLFRRRGRRS